jgi:hypothetical protein
MVIQWSTSPGRLNCLDPRGDDQRESNKAIENPMGNPPPESSQYQ